MLIANGVLKSLLKLLNIISGKKDTSYFLFSIWLTQETFDTKPNLIKAHFSNTRRTSM
ncbi:unnamed protein product [Linum tenue]|nr:unnamed protein product [Linum tenue]